MPKIAIDGYAAAGKGTLAKKLAQKLQYEYLDSGKIYRYAAFKMMQMKIIEPNDGIEQIQKKSQSFQGICTDILHNLNQIAEEKLYQENVSQMASKIAAVENFRQIVIKPQRQFMQQNDNAIIDGRDIASVIYPKAEVKIFVSANIQVRAQRRYQQLVGLKQKNITLEMVKKELIKRDQRDLNRKFAPLKKTEDAIEIDTSDMQIQQMLEVALKYVYKIIKPS